jgi:hypothetical protein
VLANLFQLVFVFLPGMELEGIVVAVMVKEVVAIKSVVEGKVVV